MHGFLTATAALCCLLIQPVAWSAPVARSSVKAVVDGVIAPLMQRHGIPGMAVGVVVDGTPYVFDYGVASLATHAPVTDDTLFELGSVSKTFTAALAALARVDGSLSLKDPVDRFLPTLQGTPFGRVTLLELGTHTPGGLPLQVPDSVRDDAQLLAYFKAWRPTCVPGTCRTYTNIGIGTLGLITARNAGQSFVSMMEQKILRPLGLRDTWYRIPADRVSGYAQGYTATGTPIRMAPGELDDEAYGIRTSAADMVRFLQANLGVLQIAPKLQSAIALTHTGFFVDGSMTQDLIWEQYPYPVALSTLLDGNSPHMLFDTTPVTRLVPPRAPQPQAWLNKTGSTNGFSAYVAFIPSRRLGIVLLANKSYPVAARVAAAYAIVTRLAGRP